MTISSTSRTIRLPAMALAGLLLTVSATFVLADDSGSNRSGQTAVIPGVGLKPAGGDSGPQIMTAPGSPVEEFSKQLEDFQKSVPDLNKKIQDDAVAIDSTSDVGQAKAEIDSLRDQVSTLLGAVSDNGPVSQLGAKALNHIHDKLKQLSQDGRFKPEERQYLIDQWQRIETQTESATKELDDARGQFVSLLQTLQTNEDFIGELLEIRQAEKALEVIRSLSHDIRDASTQLNKLIGSIKPPGV